MNAHQEATLSTLHDLIDICRDGEEGFRKASESIHKDSELKMLLMSFSLQRGKFARELEAEITAHGGEIPKKGGTMTGSIHRWWMDLEGRASHDNRFILGECERGEDAAKEAYHKAVQESMNMPDSLRALLLRQQQEVLKVHDVVKRRRDGTWSSTEGKMEEAKHQLGEKLSSTQEKIYTGAGEIADRATEKWEDIKVSTSGKIERASNKIGSFIRRNPIPVLIGALGAGIAIGLYFRNRELRNERERLWLMRHPLSRLGLGAKAAMEELKLRAMDNMAAVQDRMEDLQSKGRKGPFKNLRKKLRHAMESFS